MKQLQITITLDISDTDERELNSCEEISKKLKELFVKRQIFNPLEVIDVKTNKIKF